ncbi:hypothetical protein B296_00057442, partial [Ensete ventricosum]
SRNRRPFTRGHWLQPVAPCKGPGRSRPPPCRGPWLQTNAPLQVVGRPYKGAGRGHARLPLVRASFATKT